jgi:hypothetical protein
LTVSPAWLAAIEPSDAMAPTAPIELIINAPGSL